MVGPGRSSATARCRGVRPVRRFQHRLAGLLDGEAEFIAGDPVITTRNVAVDTSRFFYGVSADYAWPGRKIMASVYWLDQRASGIVDRQAIGGELRFAGSLFSGYGVIDVDVHFGQLS